jgi:predicted alpha/beta superfamily hydrolase
VKTKQVTYQSHEIKEHLIRSSFVSQAFKIKVLQPISRTDQSERFPVLYITDSDFHFGGFATFANYLQTLGETPRFILVGIGYEDANAAQLLRWRDFVTHGIRAHFEAVIEKTVGTPFVSHISDTSAITKTTDAKDFLHFIRKELMPFVNASYPTHPDDNSYFGYSLGGTFGLYTLFSQPGTFRRYILGSPGTSYGGCHFGIELAKEFIQSGHALDAKVFMSIGELEEFGRGHEQFDLVTGYYLLAKFLKISAIPRLELTVRMFPGESHATAWPLAFGHGLRTLFGPEKNVPYWPGITQ